MTTNPEVFIRRNKLRRRFETEFKSVNDSIRSACASAGIPAFFIKYSNHLLDRAIQREIDEEYVFALFHKVHNHVTEIHKFLEMPMLPIDPSEIDPEVEYRPQRLEITDGTLWLGMTVSLPNPEHPFRGHSMQCRMAFVNDKRLKGKISTKIIKL